MVYLKRMCPVCGSGEGEFLKNIPVNLSPEIRGNINYPDSYDIVWCNQCGMVFADSSLSREDIDLYYTQCNMYDNASHVKQDTYSETYQVIYKTILPYLTSESRIIDVGCGNGMFLRYLKSKGYTHLYGLDPSESSMKQLDKNGISGEIGSIYEKIPDEMHGRFDICILVCVLEHLLLPADCLGNIVKLIKKGGLLYIMVPNAEGFEKYLREIPNYFNHEHINYFSTTTLDYLCGQNQLFRCSSDEKCQQIVTPLSPEMVINAVYQYIPSHISTPPRMINMPDEKGKHSVLKYFSLAMQKKNTNKAKIEKMLGEHKEIIIWGTGGLSASLLADIPELAERVECFVDNNIQRQSALYWGKRVISPARLNLYPHAVILICIMINRDSVIKQIQQMQLPNQVLLLS